MPQVLAEELKSIPMSPNLGESLERAHRAAREQSHRFVLLEHLLLALTDDPEASIILQSANVDLGRLATDVSGYLGRLMDDMRADGGAEPRPDAELLRVLQAAASAAQQSKRRHIDGSIVLAAIVGDGKSPAAGLLKTHGMTFEQAIRALQLANTKARLKPIAKAPKPVPSPAPAPEAPVEHAPAIISKSPSLVEATAAVTLPVAAIHTQGQAKQPEQAPPPASPEPRSRRQAPAVQSADDILAAARARIQRRTGMPASPQDAAVASITAPDDAKPDVAQDLHAVPSPPVDEVSDAMRDLLAAAAPPAPVATNERPDFNGAHADRPDSGDTATLPRTEPARPRLVASGEPAPEPPRAAPTPPFAKPGLRAPPASQMAPAHQPQPTGFSRGDPLPPWPSTVPPPPAALGPVRPGAGPGPLSPGAPPRQATLDSRRMRQASAPLPSFPAPPPPRKQQGNDAERGPIVEVIPRRMRLESTALGEVRIARDRLDALVQALAGRGSSGLDQPVVRALTVRLKSPSGEFFIEPVTPETQWVEQGPHALHAEPLTWAWHITPRSSGKDQLVLMVSLRSVEPDGAGEEVAAPDRVLDVKVKGRAIRRLLRGLLWTAVLAGTFFLGRIGGELFPMLFKALRQAAGV